MGTRYPLGLIALLLMGTVLIVSCKKSEEPSDNKPPPAKTITVPTVAFQIDNLDAETHVPYVAGHDSIVAGGDVIFDGGGTVTERGVCWGTSQNPTVAGSRTSDGTGKGYYVGHIGGLTVNTTYYLRAYATNSAGTGYSQEVALTTAYRLGEQFGGGIIFYIDPSTLHGLIETQYGGSEVMWGNGIVGAYSTDDGAGNTRLMLQGFGGGTNTAAGICAACRDGGYSDWFLPAINQLTLMGTPPNGDTYWSSTESTDNTSAAYVTGPPYGNPYAEYKLATHEVRPIRVF